MREQAAAIGQKGRSLSPPIPQAGQEEGRVVSVRNRLISLGKTDGQKGGEGLLCGAQSRARGTAVRGSPPNGAAMGRGEIAEANARPAVRFLGKARRISLDPDLAAVVLCRSQAGRRHVHRFLGKTRTLPGEAAWVEPGGGRRKACGKMPNGNAPHWPELSGQIARSPWRSGETCFAAREAPEGCLSPI